MSVLLSSERELQKKISQMSLREKIGNQYRNDLEHCQYIPDNYTSSYALFSILLESNQKRNRIIEQLQKNNIPTMIYYQYPLHLMKAFSYLGYRVGDLPISEKLSKTILNLPMHPYLSDDEIKSVILNVD